MPSGRVALAQKVSRMAVWKIWQAYKKYGKDGLKDHKAGRLFEPLNNQFYKRVVDEWNKQRCGARKLHAILKKKGFSVSLRKISQVLKTECLQKPCPKRQRPRKYKRYEWPLPNFMWHTDWHVIKAEKLKGQNFISYLDDCSRKIMAHGVFDAMTTRNSLLTLYKAIAQHKVTPFELNSDRGSQFIPSKVGKKGKANSAFQEVLQELGILFIPSRRRHPQTNGKLEKFHHILDTEFDDRFETIDQFIDWYNNERASEAVDYMTPKEAYEKRL
ncbi:MAG: DDE-type integrase/transposase/recombinase [Candidatus Woesearchaeota archaeon]